MDPSTNQTVSPTSDEQEAALGLAKLADTPAPTLKNIDQKTLEAMENAIKNLSVGVDHLMANKEKHDAKTFRQVYAYLLQYLVQLRNIIAVGNKDWSEEGQREIQKMWGIIGEAVKTYNNHTTKTAPEQLKK